MANIGVILEYDADLGAGLIRLSSGEQKTFNRTNWIDTDNQPSVGRKVSYHDHGYFVEVKVANEEGEALANSVEDEPNVVEEVSALTVIKALKSVDAYVEHYMDNGFKLLDDSDNDNVRTVSLRLYTPNDYGEAKISYDGSKLSVVQVINGKKITNT